MMFHLINAQYIEVNTIGICILFFMYLYMVQIKHHGHTTARAYFSKMLLCNICILFFDTFIFVMRWYNTSIAIVLNHVACIIFFTLNTLFTYYWFMYSFYRLYPNRTLRRRTSFLLFCPVLFSFLLTAGSPWTSFIYTLTNHNEYIRGDFLFVSTLLSLIYWIGSISILVMEMIHPDMIREKRVYTTLLFAPLPTFIGDIIQMKFYGLSVIWICSALSLFVLFINLQNIEISRDMLTGLFNRRQTNSQIAWEIKRLKNCSDYTFFVMIDLDYFKQINDTYGHLEGDHALIAVGQILHKGFREKDFIGRYGGDEFIVIGHVSSESQFHFLLEHLNHLLNEYNRQHKKYSISLSIGYKLYTTGDTLTVDSVISAIDREMYLVKKAHRK